MTTAQAKNGRIGISFDKQVVQSVRVKGPAANAGLKPGDKIISADGEQLTGEAIHDRDLINGRPDTTVVLEVLRSDETLRLTVIRKNLFATPKALKVALLIPVAWLLIFTWIHFSMNREAERLLREQKPDNTADANGRFRGHIYGRGTISTDPSESNNIFEITPSSMMQMSGSWAWRFFNQGYIAYKTHQEPDSATQYFLHIGVPSFIAISLNPLNPTGFLVFVILCIISAFVAWRATPKFITK